MGAFLETILGTDLETVGEDFGADAADFFGYAAAFLLHAAGSFAFGALGGPWQNVPIQATAVAYPRISAGDAWAGTPLMLQLIFFWFGLKLGRYGFSRMETAIVAFVLNYAAYFAEIYTPDPRGSSRTKGSSQCAGLLNPRLFSALCCLSL